MPIDRRTLLKSAAGVGVASAWAYAMAPLAELTNTVSLNEFLQKHYKELTREELALILERIERETRKRHGVEVDVKDVRPEEGVEYAYALNLGTCNGCRRCAEACTEENNLDRASGESYIRVLEIKGGSVQLDRSTTDYDHPVPQPRTVYMPVQCQQCDNPPCVSVCPVEATWKEPDGIVVVDYDWCIGCRYCIAACPYQARRFNWRPPTVSADEINPDQAYLSNRIRPAGVVEKCHFCLHRVREGRQPACLEACPTGARVFGNMLDPESDIRWVLENKRTFVLKAELGTQPRFYYYFDG